MEKDEEIEIEKLPTIGEAISIKTIKQGRRTTISKMIDPLSNMKRLRRTTKNDIIFSCKRIMKYKGSTEAQRKLAAHVLDLAFKGVSIPNKSWSAIVSMNIRFSKLDRNY